MGLKAIAAKFDLDALNNNRVSMAAISSDGRICWANKAWFEFAATNGAAMASVAIGVDYFAPMQPEIRGQLQQCIELARRTRQPFTLDYECSSPSRFRQFRLQGLPLDDDTVLFVNSLRVERAHDRVASEAQLAEYEGASELLTMCAHCRRVRRADRSAWDWIPDWVEAAPGKVSHGLCETCSGFEWGRLPTRILLVHDEAMIRRVISRLLTDAGYEVAACATTSAAREELMSGSFDVLLADRAIPDGSGIDLARWARVRQPALRCVVVSGTLRPAELELGIGWVTKPFTGEELLRPLPPAR